MSQLLFKPLRLLLLRSFERTYSRHVLSSSSVSLKTTSDVTDVNQTQSQTFLSHNYSSPVAKLTSIRQINTSSSLFGRRRKRGDDDDIDGEDSPSLAYSVRREMQQKRERELSKPKFGRMAHYQESSSMGLEGKY